MGLLEKAFKYKDEINKRGNETLIDRIIGPAETEFIKPEPVKPAKPAEPESVSAQTEEKIYPEPAVVSNAEKKSASEDNSIPEKTADIPQRNYPAEEAAPVSDEPVFVDLSGEAHPDDEMVFISSDELLEVNEQAAADPVMPAGGVPDEILLPEPDLLHRDLFEDADLIAEEILKSESGASKTEGELPAEPESSEPEYESSAPHFRKIDAADDDFDDYQMLYETAQEILTAETLPDLTDVILFLVMGQMGSSSSSILLPDADSPDKWIISDSRGIKAAKKDIIFDSHSGIIRELHENKSVLDIDTYKNVSGFAEDYIKFISIDTKIIVPLIYDDEITGILILGEKISGEDYTSGDISYLGSVGKDAAIALRGLAVKKWSYRDISLIDLEINRKRSADALIKSFFSARDINELKSAAGGFFQSMGFTAYAVYIKPESEDSFIPVLADTGEYAGRGKLFLDLGEGSRLINTLSAADAESPVILTNDPAAAELVNHDILSIVRTLNLYPVAENEMLKGFICEIAPRVRQNITPDNGLITTVKQPVVTALTNLHGITARNHFKTFDLLSLRIEKELKRSKSLNIPLSLVMLSVKNYKRLLNSKGIDVTNLFFTGLESLVSRRVSDDDFFLRYDRNRILIVLPGKDKKFASAFAGGLRNSVPSLWPDDESTPLITALVSQYPADGDNLFSLLDLIE